MITSRLGLLFALPLAMLALAPMAQASCSAEARQYLQQSLKHADDIDQATREQIVNDIVRYPPPGIMDANGINDCVAQNWPGIPGTTQAVLAGLGRQVVNQLCSQARQRIAAATPSYLRNVYGLVQQAQSGNYSSFGNSAVQAAQNNGVIPSRLPIPSQIPSQITSPIQQQVQQQVRSQTGSALSGLFGGGSTPPPQQ